MPSANSSPPRPRRAASRTSCVIATPRRHRPPLAFFLAPVGALELFAETDHRAANPAVAHSTLLPLPRTQNGAIGAQEFQERASAAFASASMK
jgi:hypothetical protein